MIQELGVSGDKISESDLHFITKMHYKARADDKWIEHEIDYIFAITCDVDINPNPNEIEQTKYVNPKDLQISDIHTALPPEPEPNSMIISGLTSLNIIEYKAKSFVVLYKSYSFHLIRE